MPTSYQIEQKLGFKDGDVLGFSGKGWVSGVINLGTYALPRVGLSHIGIVSTYRGRQYIFESTTLNGGKSCAILGKPIGGVQAHLIEDVLARPGKVWVYRLKSPLYKPEKSRLGLCLLGMLGVEYDYRGAAQSGGFLLRLIEKLVRNEDVSKLFCSELVAFALTRIGRGRIISSSGQNPNSLARYLYRDGIVTKRERVK